ncbi:hypothetical protein H6G41_26700 [Tolypothrix sp. FACHB-123]|uniref:hypothetical protein n=1 Tax=Tolypothrix sp. FACHB-123 TaxID=2692868 RepID=UPI0016846777|nr:hypothetical protein [Tolypothrix sp. FACHB-123]MBD2358158.1 hypothetical protein [Tolypothrix sp. FACHB-123]
MSFIVDMILPLAEGQKLPTIYTLSNYQIADSNPPIWEIAVFAASGHPQQFKKLKISTLWSLAPKSQVYIKSWSNKASLFGKSQNFSNHMLMDDELDRYVQPLVLICKSLDPYDGLVEKHLNSGGILNNCSFKHKK